MVAPTEPGLLSLPGLKWSGLVASQSSSVSSDQYSVSVRYSANELYLKTVRHHHIIPLMIYWFLDVYVGVDEDPTNEQ